MAIDPDCEHMIFRRPIGAGIILIWLVALVPELVPALFLPTPPNPLTATDIFMFWLINYALGAMIFFIMPAVGGWLLFVEPIEPPDALQ